MVKDEKPEIKSQVEGLIQAQAPRGIREILDFLEQNPSRPTFLNVLKRFTPDGQKARLHKLLSKNHELELRYIHNLSWTNDQVEIKKMMVRFRFSFRQLTTGTENSASAERQRQKLITELESYILLLSKLHDQLQEVFKESIKLNTYPYAPEQLELVLTFISTQLGELSEFNDVWLSVLVNSSELFSLKYLLGVFRNLDNDRKKKFATLIFNSVFSARYPRVNDEILELTSVFDAAEVQSYLLKIAESVSSTNGNAFAIFGSLLARANEQSRQGIIDTIGQNIFLFSELSNEQILDTVFGLTEIPTERASLFFNLYKFNREFPVNKTEDVAGLLMAGDPRQVHGFLKFDIISYFSRETVQRFGQIFLEAMLQSNDVQPYEIAEIVSTYQLSDQNSHPKLEGLIASAVENGTVDEDILAIALLINQGEVVTNWSHFEQDTNTVPEYGAETWRPEQSIIDVFQNHLDAMSYRQVVRVWRMMQSNLFGEESDSVTPTTEELNGIWYLLRYRQRPDLINWDHVYPDWADKKEDIISILAGLNVRLLPDVYLLMLDADGVQKWVSREDLDQEPGSIVGIRIVDNGYGFSNNLSTSYIPTKNKNVDFNRGQFGQGYKLCMLRLIEAGCEIEITSNAIVERSKQVVEWSGSPTIDDQTGTMQLVGKERKRFAPTSPIDNLGGSSTMILFEQADDETQKLFRRMLDSRVFGGIGDFILDYSPEQDDYIAVDKVRVSVSTAAHQQGRVFVKGLEFPFTDLALKYRYNFTANNIRFGRDRKALDASDVAQRIKNAWQNMEDITSLERLYSDVIKVPRERQCFEQSAMFHPHFFLDQQAKERHAQAFTKVIRLNLQSEQKVFFVSRKDDNYQHILEQIKTEGHIVLSGLSETTITHLSGLLSTDKVGVLADYQPRDQIEAADDTSSHEHEQLLIQLKPVLQSAKDITISLLRENDFQVEADKLENLSIRPTIVNRNIGDVPVNITIFDTVVSVQISLLRILGTDFSSNRSLTADDLTYITFLATLHLLDSAVSIRTENHKKIFHSQQALATKLIGLNLGSVLVERLKSINRVASPGIQRLIESEEDESETANEVFFLLWTALDGVIYHSADVTYQDLTRLIALLNRIPSSSLEDHGIRSKLSTISNQIFEIDGNAYLVEDLGQSIPGAARFELKILPKSYLDVDCDYTVEQIGSGAQMMIRIPHGLFNPGGLTLSYLDSRIQVNRNDPTGIDRQNRPGFIDEASAFLEFSELAWCDQQFLYLKIGHLDPEVIAARLRVISDQSFLIEARTMSELEEMHQNDQFIKLNASDEYGSGVVWDDPIRFFCDLVQNHLDAGEVNLEFRVDGNEEWLGADQVNQLPVDKKIVGFRVLDNGPGFNTTGLFRWGASVKPTQEARGRYGEGLKMLAISCQRNGLGLRISSRGWTAKMGAKSGTYIDKGVTRSFNQVGFEMNWHDSTSGTMTELTLPPNVEAKTANTWASWMQIIDPRQQANETGFSGLQRYVRDFRTDVHPIQLGRIILLPQDPGNIYERGLVVPDQESVLGKKLLFGYDFLDQVISSQERNRVDRAKLNAKLEDFFAHAPYDIVLRVMREVAKFDQLGQSFLEFDYIHAAHPKLLAKAFYEVFGASATLSSLSEAQIKLEHSNLSPEELVLYRQIVKYEQLHENSSDLVILEQSVFHQLNVKLADHVRSTKMVVKRLLKEPLEVDPEVLHVVSEIVKTIAGLIKNNFEHEPPKSTVERLLNSNLATQTRSLPRILFLDAEKYTYLIDYLSQVEQGTIPIDVKVHDFIGGVGGYASGINTIGLNAEQLAEREKLVGTIAHELLHLASGFPDYNPIFSGLLLLATGEFSSD